MAIEIKIPLSLCVRVYPSQPFLAVENTHELKPKVEDWFTELGGTYDLQSATYFDGKSMIVEIILIFTDETLATHFKLRWL